MGLEHQRIALEHVRVHRRERCAPGADPLACELQQLRTRGVMQVRRPERPYNWDGSLRHDPRFPRTAVTRNVWSALVTAMTTVSPGW